MVNKINIHENPEDSRHSRPRKCFFDKIIQILLKNDHLEYFG